MSEHDINCDYGDDPDEFDMIVVNIDDKDVECVVLGIFDVENNEYIALIPNSEELEDEILFFGYSETKEGVELLDIESEEEYNNVYDVFQELMMDSDFPEE